MSRPRWGVHPQPLPDETLSSWITRTAHANASRLSTWLAAELGRFLPRTNLDTRDDPKLREILAERTAIIGGADAVRALTFIDAVEAVGAHAASRWLLAIEQRVDRPKQRWCACCLANDAEPYFRRAWRWEWMLWCPLDGARLRDACAACGSTLEFQRLSWKSPLSACWRCDRSLGCANQNESAAAPQLIVQSSAWALTALASREGEHRETWAATWCLQKWIERLCPRRWGDVRGALRVARESDLPLEWPVQRDERAALSFALAWHLATDGRAELPSLARRFQASFNRATVYRCPPSLAPLRRLLATPQNVTEARVTKIVDELLASGQAVHYAVGARALDVDPHAISDRPELRALVDLGTQQFAERRREAMRERLVAARDRLSARGARLSRAELAAEAGVTLEVLARWERETGETFAVSPRETYEERVREAAAVLVARGERVTTVGVCRVLGMDRSLVEKRPELKGIIRECRDARTTAQGTR